MQSPKHLSRTPLAIIGAGPHGLTLATHLLQKRKDTHRQFQVIDPSGRWMTQWQKRFQGLEIPYLRSPSVHHPDPLAGELRNFAESHSSELYNPYGRPGTELFHDFCHEVVKRWELENTVTAAKVIDLQYQQNLRRYPFCLQLDNGQEVQARRVVLATGAGRKRLPEWVNKIQAYPKDSLCHSDSIRLPEQAIAGQTILIVGNGLSSAHLAVGAAKRGAKVIMMARRKFYAKIFDADPGWLGPKFLKKFHADPSWHKRHQMIQEARNGGSVTPELMFNLRRLERQGQLTFYEHCEVDSAHWQGKHWKIHCQTLERHICLNDVSVHRIWLATGTDQNLQTHPLLQNIQTKFPIEWVNGLPVLDEHLRWPNCELFIMGAGAALQVGPVARNLAGARMASDRIVPALTKRSLALRIAS